LFDLKKERLFLLLIKKDIASFKPKT